MLAPPPEIIFCPRPWTVSGTEISAVFCSLKQQNGAVWIDGSHRSTLMSWFHAAAGMPSCCGLANFLRIALTARLNGFRRFTPGRAASGPSPSDDRVASGPVARTDSSPGRLDAGPTVAGDVAEASESRMSAAASALLAASSSSSRRRISLISMCRRSICTHSSVIHT